MAFSVGTVSVALSVKPLSVENSLTGTPRLNPIPSRLLSAILLENVTWPVPWSTRKNGPTEKLPN